MANLGRRRGDGVGYQRGRGSIEVEMANMQSVLEILDPKVAGIEGRVDQLESDRDTAKGMLKVIMVLEILIVGLVVALFAWGLNHMSFHSDFERPEHSDIHAPQDSAMPQGFTHP